MKSFQYLYNCLIVVLLLVPYEVIGQQNHVINGSFEDTIGCPNAIGQLTTKCVGWNSLLQCSADFFHTCGNSNSGVPQNAFGYQAPADGYGYAGTLDYYPLTPNYREFMHGRITPLVAGWFYDVSMSVSRANYTRFATNGLGVFFYDTGYNNATRFIIDSVVPQISYSQYGSIADTANWVRLTASFWADSAYDNIIVGGFIHDSLITVDTISSQGSNYCYYYVDSVVVKLSDSLFFRYPKTLFCAGDTISIDYFSTKKKQSNNKFTIQLSNAVGSFNPGVPIGSVNSDTSGTIVVVIPANTPTGVGYRMRIIASNYPDTNVQSIHLRVGMGPISKPVASSPGYACSDDTLFLTASSTTPGVNYKWTGPENFNSNVQNPSIPNPLPANGGEYIVTAYLYGCEAKDTTAAVVYTGVATTNAPVCAGDTLTLSGTANGTSNSYSWTGPNSFSSSQQNLVWPMPTSVISGDYILLASDGNCVSRDTVTVLVKPRPDNSTTSSNSPQCIGSTINLFASSSSQGVTYSWVGPVGFNSTSSSPSINGAVLLNSGNYYITTTLNGCSLTDTLTVLVKPLPAKPVAGSNTPVCAGDSLQLTVGNISSVSYGWAGPLSFTSGIQNPTITNASMAMSGDYIVTATLNGCVNKDTTTVTIKPMADAVTLSNNSPLCVGDTLTLSSTTSTTGVVYGWSGPLSFSANTQNGQIPGVSQAMTGWYKMTADLNGCIYADSTYVTIFPVPSKPSITFNNPICTGETLNLSTGAVSGVIYNWTGPGNFTSNQQNPTRANMQFGDTGIYKATITVNGCTSPIDSVRVGLNRLPFVVILSNPADSICQGDPVVFTALPNNSGGTPGYLWKVNAQHAGTGSVFNTSTLNDGDVIVCEMTENTKCSTPYMDESNDIQMTVLPWLAPTVSITANPTHPLDEYEYITFTALPVNAGKKPKYQWKRNGQDIVGATGSIWSANTLNNNDSVSVEIISDYECPQPTNAKSNWIRVTLTGTADIDLSRGITIYPNPNNGRFIIEMPAQAAVSFIEVLNAVGQVVYKERIAPTDQAIKKEVAIGDVPGGIYLLRLRTGDGVLTGRFRVE